MDLPLGAGLTFLRCWVRLYGMVSLEVFGHLHFALEDAAPMFEITLAELAKLVNLEYPPHAAISLGTSRRTASPEYRPAHLPAGTDRGHRAHPAYIPLLSGLFLPMS